MADGKREEIERRVVALVRDFLDDISEKYEDGYEIADFIIVWHVLRQPSDDFEQKPWHGGPLPGWWPQASVSSTVGSWTMEQTLLEWALEGSRAAQARSEEEDEEDDEEE